MNLNHLCQLPKDKSPAIGCIGAGFIMRDCHLVSYKSNGFNSIAVAELDEGCRKELIEKHPDIPNIYKSHQELLENKEIEIIDIAVPPQHQIAVIRDVVKHKHIKEDRNYNRAFRSKV